MRSLSRDDLWAALSEEVRSVAARLDLQRSAEDAFPVAIAEEVVAALEEAGALILGGDFWLLQDDGFHPAYANWSYDGQAAAESLAVARRTLIAPWVDRSWYVTFVWK